MSHLIRFSRSFVEVDMCALRREGARPKQPTLGVAAHRERRVGDQATEEIADRRADRTPWGGRHFVAAADAAASALWKSFPGKRKPATLASPASDRQETRALVLARDDRCALRLVIK
jgi:hypothetical protein